LNVKKPVCVTSRKVSRKQPSIPDCASRLFNAVPVAPHDLWPLHDQFADFPVGYLLFSAFHIYYSGFRIRQWETDAARTTVIGSRNDRVHMRHRTGFSQAISLY